ncbi:MAG: ATP-dependent DNA helicase RecQ, partial [Bacteroidota bacterium]
MTLQQILTKYWGYSGFKPLQEDIINSVMAGNDTLALLPTGGGKSLCFQVPALAKEGLCLVVSPLIALMKDQVESLKRRNIKAIAVYSGMTAEQIDIALDNAVFDKEVKFLYVSPERLITDLFRERLKRMKVNLLAIDEAHCVSQWGYDFRPPYLKIAEIREYLPGVPLLALSATATPIVVTDIQQKLVFKKDNVIQASFERKNLSYFIRKEENKQEVLLRIIRKVKGSGIVYVRNRKKTKLVADFLNQNRIGANFYHAGLDHRTRDAVQKAWTKGLKQVIVATNAFGMGIDKPDVRFVVHMDLPDSIESYFQEAGRAGRDDKKSFAVLLYENADIIDLYQHFESSYPDKEIIKSVYTFLCYYFQLAMGTGRDSSFVFNINQFADHYNLSPAVAYNSIKFLEKEGYVALSETFNEPSKLHFLPNKNELYKFQLQNPKYDSFIKLILLSYTGVFNDFVKIDENELARHANLTTEQTLSMLKDLASKNVLKYNQRSDLPYIFFTSERQEGRDVLLSDENYALLKENALKRMEAMTDFIAGQAKCRSRFLLEYFGETDTRRCGICDVCQKRNDLGLTEMEFDKIVDQIRPLLQSKAMELKELISLVKGVTDE